MEARQPVFRVPGADDLSGAEFVDIDGLNVQPSAGRFVAHEALPLSPADFRSDGHLAAVLEDVPDFDRQIGKCASEFFIDLLEAGGAWRLAAGCGSVDPNRVDDPVDQ